MSDQLDIVSGASGATQQLLEFELRSSAASERDVDCATPDFLRRRMRRVVDWVAQECKPSFNVLLGFGSKRMVVNARRWTGDFTVVRGRVEIDHFQRCLQKIDAGNKGLSLDAILVQFVRMSVGCCYKNNSVGHEGLEKSVRNQ